MSDFNVLANLSTVWDIIKISTKEENHYVLFSGVHYQEVFRLITLVLKKEKVERDKRGENVRTEDWIPGAWRMKD